MTLLLDESQTAITLAGKMNIFESAVRKHLQTLENAGLVSSSFEQRGLGRPKKLYSVTGLGAELFARKYDMLLDMMIDRINETYGQPVLRSMILAIARDLGNTPELSTETVNFRERLKTAAEVLDNLGFATELAEKDGEVSIISRNCVLRRTAEKNHDLICRKFHGELIRSILKHGKIKLHECMVEESTFCRHVITKLEREE